jgi:predicted Zn-dependent protease
MVKLKNQYVGVMLAVSCFWVQPLAWANEGVQVGKNSAFAQLVPARQVEQAAAQEYQKMLQQADRAGKLVPASDPRVKRLRTMAQAMIPLSHGWNPRARSWKWEVHLIESDQINAFCMPGGKIAFYTGLIDKLKLTDDEIAMVMGHEIAHALREHARERMGKGAATDIGASLLSQFLGLGQLGQTVTSYGAQLLTLKFSRENESDADLVGMDLAARAGFDPRASISLWRKMSAARQSAPPEWLSTHPSSNSRIAEMEANMDKVLPLYERSVGR